MKLKKQSISIAIATTLLLSLLTACSSSGNDGTSSPTNEPTASATAQASASEETGSGTNGKFDPPVTINTVGCVVGTELFKGDETQENNVATKWAKESLGIDVKYMWMTKEDQCSSKIRLALSSNEALPDVLFTYDQQLVADLTQSGKLMDLGEAFDKYASDEFKSSLSDATLWYKGMKDGKRYALPVLESRHQNEPLFWFREDWLKKLELQAPKTIEDLEAVMDAFVNRDPDGNNEKDTVGISLGFANGFNQNMADTSWLFGAYGAMPGFYIKGADGKLVYGSTQPGAKQALAKLRDWMQKGYVGKDAFSQGGGEAAALVTNGKSGILPGPYWQIVWPIQDVAKTNPGAEMRAHSVPSAADGTIGFRGIGVDNSFVVVNKDFKHVDALFAYLNKLYEGMNFIPGSEFANGFFEGYDYVMQDGKPVYDGSKVEGGLLDIRRNFIVPPPANADALFNNMVKLHSGVEPTTPAEIYASGAYPKETWEAAALLDQVKDRAIYNQFKGVPTPTMLTKGDYLSKLESETFSKIVFGELPIDAFDKFVEDWQAGGGEQILQEVNAWYASVNP
ncbi:extracellular solute-binding protein [Cohnella sp. LGH]|uniref:extracellular solute-binding protein n=1 Tax=Cohnella sp. LGH TaxID=1619153 RepID=UPI001ADB84D7|nr:extracellular solute-binding protein [Cohnella sp. LGH]QTH43932.1 extracellular solute-binding protein [Cohnella sp. LGH]